MKNTSQNSILTDVLFKYIYREEKSLKSFLKGFFEYIKEEECLKEINAQIEYIFKKNRWKEKEKRGDILVYTKKYIISLEAQTSLNLSSLRKDLKYLSSIDAEDLDQKKEYKDAPKIIGIILAKNISPSLGLSKSWFQKYNYKSEGPEYKKLPSNIDVYILDIDKAKEIRYYEGENNLLLRHLQIIGETSKKKRRQIARESEELMIIADKGTRFYNNRKFLKSNNMYDNARIMGYGEGVDDRNIEIAKNMLRDGASVDYISKITNLSIEEIEKIQ